MKNPLRKRLPRELNGGTGKISGGLYFDGIDHRNGFRISGG